MTEKINPAAFEASRPTKFNMDLAIQELLLEHISRCSRIGVLDEPVNRFRALKQIRVMLSPGMQEKVRQHHKTLESQIKAKVDEFRCLVYKHQILFDQELMDYRWASTDKGIPSKPFPERFCQLREELDVLMDDWNELLGDVMVAMGLYFLKHNQE